MSILVLLITLLLETLVLLEVLLNWRILNLERGIHDELLVRVASCVFHRLVRWLLQESVLLDSSAEVHEVHGSWRVLILGRLLCRIEFKAAIALARVVSVSKLHLLITLLTLHKGVREATRICLRLSDSGCWLSRLVTVVQKCSKVQKGEADKKPS